MNAFDLSGKTILVTGASSGLGRQTAITASAYGARVVLTGRDAARLNETFQLLEGDGHLQITADLTLQPDIDRLVAALPVLNGMVYSTGISDLAPARFITAETIAKTFRVSFDAAVLLTAGLLGKKKLAKKQCSLVYISSISTRYPFVGGAMYISAKAALEAYARVLALELAPKGIRVNCVAPAFVRTPMLDDTAANYSQEAVNMIEARQILGLGDPEDVANSIVYYLADASKWVSATSLVLGGG
ncbi:3-oxoacyl-[acyl-carrier-protein] reductase FabG [bioreactor metagenome]|jgi:NAD(P)-dependent dehydrogenase (short-subunit alcohol dehydrogenase family)|uniref:3-oxoacyl-[acyl-carrier-protein] reductase FabG n=1 Tax=bioreactor metagenome TaxID=1076179 RepID=A0A644V6L3_9ZZZZ|nr:SDR family oxidoreductase [Lentimicrobium sp.]MEA5110854.1 SDR family oxidoreductase [Lentimicrobium sp.]HCT69927.1 3-oxoacyl-ACP reductase [Bacteroidales bacterium]